MRRSHPRLAAFLLVSAALFATFYVAVRPWYLTWGATPAELRRHFPSDEIVPDARASDTTTRAVTVRAPLAEVWFWIAQLGQDRGGFYSYELLEDLVGARMENADRLHPEWHRWHVGDKLWMYPAHKAHGQGHALLVRYDPGHVLGFATKQVGTTAEAPYNASWSFIVEPIDPQTTRLIARGRAGGQRSLLGAAFDHFVFEPVHFAMERKMLKGIAQRAEGRRISEAADVAQVVLWSLMFALVWVAAVLVFRRARWQQPLAVFAAATIAFQYLTLRQPSPIVGLLLVLGVTAALLPPRGAVRDGGDVKRRIAQQGA